MSVDPNVSATPLPGGPERTAHDAVAGSASPTTRRRRRSAHGTNWPLTIILMVCSLSVLLPFFVAVSMAFKTTDQAVLGQAFKLPAPWSLEGFREAWELTDFPKVFAISLTSEQARTVPAALAFFTGASQFEQPTGAIMAASVVVTIPVVVLVLIFQRRIVAGLTSGAVKG